MAISAADRRSMQQAITRLLHDKCTEADVRRVMDLDSGHDAALWSAMAAIGMFGLLVPEEFGGLGGGPLELESIAEVAGAALLGGPFLSSAVIAAGLLGESDDYEMKTRYMPGIATGQLIGTAALTGDAGSWTAAGVDVSAHEHNGCYLLTGAASFVTFAELSDFIIVIARLRSGLAAFALSLKSSGASLARQKSWDPTQRLSRIEFENVEASLVGGLDDAAIERALDLARVWLAGEKAGGARKIYEITIEYLKSRVQFGRPIGSFQALKHMAADLLLEVECSTSAARAAAAAIEADGCEKDALVSLAAFTCTDAYAAVSSAAIQMHGGIAFTWDHPAHLYWRRASSYSHFLGASDAYRERYLTAKERV